MNSNIIFFVPQHDIFSFVTEFHSSMKMVMNPGFCSMSLKMFFVLNYKKSRVHFV
jgi:hypothetical protein